jgi:hypothetical protein
MGKRYATRLRVQGADKRAFARTRRELFRSQPRGTPLHAIELVALPLLREVITMHVINVFLLALLAQVPATPPAEPTYKKIEINEPDVQEAAKVVFAKRKGSLISAERHSLSANNLRLCVSMNRSSSSEFARVVLSRDSKKKRWNVDIWTWGSCGR